MDTNLAIPNDGMFERIGLTESPFPVTPDASRYFCSKRLESHVLELMHCIHMRKGFLLFTADIGLGKSTLSRYLINNLEKQKTDISLVLNTFLQGVELLKAINEDFGLQVDGGVKEQLDALNAFLLERYSSGYNCLIIIDDAQNLTTESLEMIRLISNFEVSTHKLVQILLIAQPEIMLTLNLPQIRQLKSRIALNIELAPFTESEVHDYVYFRLNGAGNTQDIKLLPKAVKLLHQLSRGYPRRINLIMDRALYALLVDAGNVINHKIISLANNDLEQTQHLVDINNGFYSKNRMKYVAASFILIASLTFIFWEKVSYEWITGFSSIPVVVNESHTSLPGRSNTELVATDKEQIKSGALSEIPSEKSVKISTTEKQKLDGESINDLAASNTKVLGLVNSIEEQVTKVKVEEAPEPIEQAKLQSKLPILERNVVLEAFLQSYELADIYPELIKPFERQDWVEVTQVFKQQNWVLLLNEKPFIEPPRSVLKIDGIDGKSQWLMLWKPELTLEKYYFGFQSKDVAILQRLLTQEGFFSREEDATIGSHTMYAVASFQRSIGMEPTGKADALTLYFLTQDNRALAQINSISGVTQDVANNHNEVLTQ